MGLYVEQSAAAQAAYAGLAQAARQHDSQRSIADVPGSFSTKRIKGRTYHYYQHKSPDGRPQQFYIGPDDEATRQLIASASRPERDAARQHLVRLCNAAEVLGCFSVGTKHARALLRLSDHGFFRAGSTLVGNHAYLAYQNRFGVQWTGGESTADPDPAQPGRKISMAVPNDVQADTHVAIEFLKMGFVPVNAGTRYVKPDESDLDLDFVTSLHRGGQEPVAVSSLNVSLQPLRFMEFAMEDPLQVVLPSSLGPIVTNVPRPERYALAKLVVYGERLAWRNAEKAPKDLLQAATLVSYLQERDPDPLADAWQDLWSRGPRWRKLATSGVEALEHCHPDLQGTLSLPAPAGPSAGGLRP